jgi:hypothetical protein
MGFRGGRGEKETSIMRFWKPLSFAAATIFMVLVIRWMDLTEARRRRSAFTLAMLRSPDTAAAAGRACIGKRAIDMAAPCNPTHQHSGNRYDGLTT